MKLERGLISSSQLMFLIIGVAIPFTSLGMSAKHDAWLATLAGLGENLIFTYILITLVMMFPGKTLVEFNDIIYGPYLGKVISLGYLWYFLHIACIVLRNFGDFFISTIYPETPMVVLIISLVLISTSAVRNGIEGITRCSIILTFIIVFANLSTLILLLKDMEFSNLLPILDLPFKKFIKASHSAANIPMSLITPFLMIYPFLNNIKQAKTSTMKSLILTTILLVMISVQNITVLGVTAAIGTYPTYGAMRMMNIAKIITRLEIIATFNLISLEFLKVIVLHYGTVLGIAQILKLRSYLPLVFPIGILMVALSVLLFDSYIEWSAFVSDIYPYYSIPFTFGIPLLSLIIAMIRGLQKSSQRELKR